VTNPHTTVGAGGAAADPTWPLGSSQGNAIEIAPFLANTTRCWLERALAVGGRCSVAALDLSTLKSTPIALWMAGGSLMKFNSGTGGNQDMAGNPLGPPTWYFGSFTPVWGGALAIMVDGSTLYIPVCSNHP
jgi:hypothetical protein